MGSQTEAFNLKLNVLHTETNLTTNANCSANAAVVPQSE